VKTAVLYWLRDHGYSRPGNHTPGNAAPPSTGEIHAAECLPDLCASFQAAVADVLMEKLLRAVNKTGVTDVGIAGGVSANAELRRRAHSLAKERGFRLFIPNFEYCTDNGAMIAMAGTMRFMKGITSGFELNAVPNLSL
jgi:N6-L-threonylcarbamoyladenine synthase